MSERSSNYRELRNILDDLKGLCEDRKLKGCELFLFTDNLVVVHAYYKDSLVSRMVFDLVLRMIKIHITWEFILTVTRISGIRVQECGMNSLSRGITAKGMIFGIMYCPICLCVCQRCKEVKDCWIGLNLGS